MTNIMEFLLARLDDDEAIARNALHSDATEPGVWMSEHHDSEFNLEPNHCHIAEDRAGHYWTVASEVFIPIAEHMARHDPARVLRDVAAKRAVIAALMEIPEVGKDAGFRAISKSIPAMAAVYSDHPDYQKEWAL